MQYNFFIKVLIKMLETEITTDGRVSILALRGRYELSTVSLIENIFREQLLAGFEIIGFDFKELNYIDSSGIGSLIRCKNLAEKQKREIVLFNLSSDIQMVFQMSRLDTILNIVSGETFENDYLHRVN